MSAPETLRQEMTRHHLYMTDERADELINAFAHELAQQQRASAKEWGLALDDDPYVGVGDVIDVIDPQLGAGPVRPDEETTP